MNRKIVRIKVKNGNEELCIESCWGQNLLEVLQNNNVYVPNICLGNGTCGKCKVRLWSGNLPITEADRRILSEKELKQGIHLACKANIKEVCKALEDNDLNIEIIGKSEDDIVIEGISVKEEKTGTPKKQDLEEIRVNNNSQKKTIKKMDNSEYKKTIEVRKVNGKSNQSTTTEENYFIAIDIGTTTIAMVLADAETGKVCDTYTSLNHQRKFGADVISRVLAANDGKAEELKQLIEEDLWNGIQELTRAENKTDLSTNVTAEAENKQCADLESVQYFCTEKEERKIAVSRIIISGNTTMIHLLMGYSCQSLGKYPFISEHLEQIECTLQDCITLNPDSTCSIYEKVPVTILAGISAFIGGDIVAGILTCSGFETEEICLLIDLGTNGEMVLGNKNKLLAASTAAGPAFEGGNIICGAASIPGSVCQVKIQNQRAVIKTIKNIMPPNGICGTGLVSAIAQLKQNKLMNKQGELRYPYNEKGYPLWTLESGEKIALYQQDIREFQMAKSAIRAGIENLMQEYGCTAKDISRVYLAGGFGVNLSEEDAICTGILPEEFRGRIEPIGNGALQGAIQVGRGKTETIGNGALQGAIQVDREKAGTIERGELQEIIQVVEKQKNRETIDKKIKGIIERTKNVSLAESKKFQEDYLLFLDF